MQLWKKIGQLAITQLLTIAKGATVRAADAAGNLVSVPVPVAEVRTAANELTAAENGKVIFLSSATEFATTLPKPAIGLSFKFVVAAAPSGASYTILSNGSANIIKGHVLSSDLNAASDGDIETSGGDTITLVDSKAVAGDVVELHCDGTTWFASIRVSAFDAATITTAS